MGSTEGQGRRWPLVGTAAVVSAVVVVAIVSITGSTPDGPSVSSEPAGTAVPAPPLAAIAARPGPSRIEGVVPVGYERSGDGAAAAATSYVSALHTLALAEPSEREAAVRRMAAPSAAAVVDQTIDGLAYLDAVVAGARETLPGARAFLRNLPVAYTVAQHDPDRARVSLWSLGVVLIEGRTEASEVWSTNTVELVWEHDDWRVWSWTRTPGPVPATGSLEPTPPAELLADIEGWEGYRYVPSS